MASLSGPNGTPPFGQTLNHCAVCLDTVCTLGCAAHRTAGPSLTLMQAGGPGSSAAGGGEEEDGIEVKGSYGTKVPPLDGRSCCCKLCMLCAVHAGCSGCSLSASQHTPSHSKHGFIAAGGGGAPPAVADTPRRHGPRPGLLDLEGRARIDKVRLNRLI